MFRAIGFIIILWGLSQFFASSFSKLDDAGVAVLDSLIMISENIQEDDWVSESVLNSAP